MRNSLKRKMENLKKSTDLRYRELPLSLQFLFTKSSLHHNC